MLHSNLWPIRCYDLVVQQQIHLKVNMQNMSDLVNWSLNDNVKFNTIVILLVIND